MKGDFLALLDSAAAGKLNKDSVYYGGGSAVCVVAASEGYPGSYEKGKVITGLEEANGSNTIVFHAGTKTNNDNIVTNGGRVLGITAVNEENDLTNTIKMAYDALEKVSFEGMYFRKDIGRKAFKHL
jgi:phosphoribosylamine--glycine ligase